jgi:hypothetical protein
MQRPPKAELKDYVWCTGCQAYVPRRLLRTEPGFFADGQQTCPDGHTELTDYNAPPAKPDEPAK